MLPQQAGNREKESMKFILRVQYQQPRKHNILLANDEKILTQTKGNCRDLGSSGKKT